MTFPTLHLTGTPYEQGVQHGQQLKQEINQNIDVYFTRFNRLGLSDEAILSRVQKYNTVLSQQNADYVAGMRGIADGSKVEYNKIVALNLRYEIVYDQTLGNRMTDGCTAFAIPPHKSADGHLYIGQNWDWFPGVKGALLHITEPDGFKLLMFTEAGIFGGKIGFNSARVAMVINGLKAQDADWSTLHKPFHIRAYEMMHQQTLAAAQEIITQNDRACATNFVLAQAPDMAINIEAAPTAVCMKSARLDALVHTNHFLEPNSEGILEANEFIGRSELRYDQMCQLVAAESSISFDDLKTYCQDHVGYPNSICQHHDPDSTPELQYVTVTSVIIDLHTQTMHLTDGAPCENSYLAYQL